MSESMLFLRPNIAAGRQVRDPDTLQLLPEEGASVPRNVFWQRRIADEDVIEGTPPEADAEEAP